MKAVFLDTSTYGKEFDLTSLKKLPLEWTFYSTSPREKIKERIASQDIIVTNKCVLTKELIDTCTAQLICVAATGYDNINLQAAEEKRIIVTNIPAYSTPSVVQLTITFLLILSENLLHYINDVRAGRWQIEPIFTILDYPFFELQGKKLGIIGYGNIGKEVAKIASAFGMEILVAQGSKPNPKALPLNEVLKQSDFVSIHTPLTAKTRDLIKENELKMMKASAFLINVSRGGLVDERALANALKNKIIAGAALDVLSQEPPSPDHPLLQKDIPNLLLTPHIAWASLESRKRAIKILYENIKAYIDGSLKNVVKSK